MRLAYAALGLAFLIMILSFAPGALLAAILEIGSPADIHHTAHRLLANHHAPIVHAAPTPQRPMHH